MITTLVAYVAGSTSPRDQRRLGRIAWVSYVSFWTALALLQFLSRMTDPAHYDPTPVHVALTRGLLDMYSWGALTLVVLWIGVRHPIRRNHWRRDVAVHLVWGVGLIGVRLFGINALAHALGMGPLATPQTLLRVLPMSLPLYAAKLGAGHALKYLHDLRERDVAAARLKSDLTAAEMQVLRLQMQPHFLFNTLNTIVSLVHHDVDAAERALVNLGEMLRRSLAPAGDPQSTVRDELAVLAPYVEIEQMRLRDRLEIEMSVDPRTLDARLPYLTLQPLVENAVRHGVAPRRGHGRIKIKTELVGGELRVVVHDNGLGSRTYRREGGVGLGSLESRLKQLYGHRGCLRVSRRPHGGTLVEVVVPFELDAPAGERAEAAVGGAAGSAHPPGI